MLKVLLLFAVIFSSCAGSASRAPVSGGFGTEYLISGPGAGTLVVIGISGRMRGTEREIDNALDDAARQIALYHGIKGKVVSVLETGAGYRDFYFAVEPEIGPLYESNYAQYREALRFDREKDLVRTDNAVFIRCVYEAPGLTPFGHKYGIENGKPAWLDGGLIEIPGYISAVGFAKNHRYLKETIAKSRESAAAALIANVSSSIETSTAERANRRTTVSIEKIEETIEGELINFMVLETWIESATGSVWTLAAAKKIQREIP
jgi:hypothetical protein